MKQLFVVLACLLALVGTAHAATYYVATTGVPGNPCTFEQPCLAISRAVSMMQPGDKLYIRGGTYNQHIAGRAASPTSTEVPSGTGPDNRTVISAYPINRTCEGDNPPDVTACYASTYEPVVLTQNNGSVGGIIGFRGARQWVTFEGLRVSGGAESGIQNLEEGTYASNPPACDSSPLPVGPTHIRYLNIETDHNLKDGVHCNPVSSRLEFLNINSHHNGTDEMNHGAYCSGNDHLFDHSQFWANAGLGAQFYRSSTYPCVPVSGGQEIRYSRFFGNNKNGAYLGGLTARHLFHDNVIYDNGGGLYIGGVTDGSSHEVYNNTIIAPWPAVVVPHKNAPSLPARPSIRNNIFSSIDLNNAQPEAYDHNWLIGQQGDPGFVDEANKDFRLQAGSPAIDAGTAIAEVSEDYHGVPRPQGYGYDIGAFEFVMPLPAAPVLSSLTLLCNKRFQLTWTDVEGAMGYKVYLKKASTTVWQPAIDVGDVTQYVTVPLTGGATYNVAVTAYNTSGESPLSNIRTKAAQPFACP
jgi:hypothetical protein